MRRFANSDSKPAPLARFSIDRFHSIKQHTIFSEDNAALVLFAHRICVRALMQDLRLCRLPTFLDYAHALITASPCLPSLGYLPRVWMTGIPMC